MVYGTEAILPIEIEILSLRVSLQNIISEEDYWVERLQELETLDVKRQTMLNHLQGYQNRLRQSYNKRVCPQTFEVGDLVLKENQRNLAEREKLGKFELN